MFDHVQAFYQPTSVREAVRLLQTLGPGSRVVAGATDLAVQAERSTRFLVDITHLGLSYVRHQAGKWVIGATTTMAELESSKLRGFANGVIAKAASTCGAIQIRNMATVGGNLVNASPAADTATPLLALDASVVMQGGKGGTKTIPLHKFWSGPHSTVLNGGLLVEIQVPDCKPRSGWSFHKLGRTESDIALVNAAAGVQCDRAGVCTDARIATGAVAPTPMRAAGAEAMMIGQKLSGELLDRVAEQVSREVRPISDVRATAVYRRAMSGVLARRALMEAAVNAGCAL